MAALWNRKWAVTVAAALAVLVVCGVVWWTSRHPPPRPPVADSSNRALPSATAPAPMKGEAEPFARLEAAAIRLKATEDPADARRQFESLRIYLASLPAPAAANAVRRFLESKADASSGWGFEVGPNGFLGSAPSLRVFLLDYLGQLDPRTASACAEAVLRSMDSPDEWAVSLRNYARAKDTPEAHEFLRQKLAQMLQHEPWLRNPSAGFLESFDVAVHLGGTALMPVLTELLRQQENQPVAHAAFLALDRLTLRDAPAVLDQLQKQPELMQGREATRANFFARANVMDARQRTILESYLLDPRIAAPELEVFAGVYPNANFMISHNLLTRNATPDGATLRRQDREALKAVEGWLADPRFEKLRPQLQKVRARLEAFTRSTQP